MVSRASTASLHETNLRYIGQLAGERSTLNKQISSGIAPQSFSDLNGSVERVSGFQEKIGKIDNYISNNRLVSTRLNATNNSLDQIQKIAEEFKNTLGLYNETTKDSFDLKSAAISALERIQDQLRTNIEGRYIFSGSRTDVDPISNIRANVTSVNIADDNYYQGDDLKLSTRISDSNELEYGITANEPALQELITGIRNAITAIDSKSDSALKSARDFMDSSKKGLANLRAKVNIDITTVTAVSDQHQQLKLFWNESLSSDIDTDLSEATIKLSSNETILQSTFSAFATISRLKLTDFLN